MTAVNKWCSPRKGENMKRVLISSILAFALVLSVIGAAAAITNGQPDGPAHPYVGLLVFDADIPGVGVVPAWSCSGSLIAPNVVLTAGHCTDGAVAARVWFNEKLQNEDFSYIVSDFPWGGGESNRGNPVCQSRLQQPRKSLWWRQWSSCVFLQGCGHRCPG